MKPYLGILVDSFWEAVSSKVLWALLVASTFVLLALAPFTLLIERGFTLTTHDLNNDLLPVMYKKMADGLDGKSTAAVQTIAKRLSPEFQEKVRHAASEKNSTGNIRTRETVEQLNKLLKDRQLFNAEAFASTAQIERYKTIIDRLPDQASELEVEELNRRLLFSAFSSEIDRGLGEQVWLAYAGFKITDPIPATKKQIQQFFEPIVLQMLLKIGLGVFVVLVSIIMTSWIIPDTFRSGSLHLMLSKPISRTLLFLSKFFGGCIFVSVNLIYIVTGLFLIAGLRFEMWNFGLLACIPLLLFVFIIFYAVSALVGLLWGNAIVSIVACMVFWGFCFALGLVRNIMHDPIEQHQLINQVIDIDGYLLTVNQPGQLSVWNEDHHIWQPATDQRVGFGGRQLTFGPFFDAHRQQIITKSLSLGGPRETRNRELLLIDVNEHRQPDSSASDKPTEDLDKLRDTGFWSTDNGPDLPGQVFSMVRLGDDLFVVSRLGLYWWDRSKEGATAGGRLGAAANMMQQWLGMAGANGGGSDVGPFRFVAPPNLVISDNTSVAVSEDQSSLLLYSGGQLTLLKWQSPKFELVAESKLEGEGTEAAIEAMSNQFCAVARVDMPIALFDSQLNSIGEIPLPKDQTPKQWSWLPGSNHQLVLVTQKGDLLKIDCQQKTIEPLRLPTTSKVTCLSWKSDHEAYVGVAPNRVQLVDLTSQQVLADYTPRPRTYERVYRWIVNPLYVVNPKPAAMDDAMHYLLTGSTTFDETIMTAKLDTSMRQLSVWEPIISNLAFVVVLLTISCIYVARKEF